MKPKKSTLKKKLDVLYAKIVRRKGFCERCGKTENLQCSHIHSRTKLSVRWDLENAFCFCAGCHLYFWHQHPIDAAEFAKEKLGVKKYVALHQRAHLIKKWTVQEMQELLKNLEEL